MYTPPDRPYALSLVIATASSTSRVALHGDHRPEDLALRERVRVVVDVDDGRFVVPARVEALGTVAPPATRRPPAATPVGDEPFDAVAVRPRR